MKTPDIPNCKDTLDSNGAGKIFESGSIKKPVVIDFCRLQEKKEEKRLLEAKKRVYRAAINLDW